jgi:hypothetical protein
MLSASMNRFLSAQKSSIYMETISGRNITVVALPMKNTWTATVTDEATTVSATAESANMDEAVLCSLYELQSTLLIEGVQWKL